MICIVLVRYSVWDAQAAKHWRLGQNCSLEEYREKLFQSQRLDLHAFLFAHLTFPSLLRQTKRPDAAWFRLIVLTSADLPKLYRDNLEALVAPYAWARIVQDQPEEPLDLCASVEAMLPEFAATHGTTFPYVTLRLDDDDALCDSFFADLEPLAAAAAVGNCISLARGYQAQFNHHERCFHSWQEIVYPQIALGLAMVHRFPDPAAGARCIFDAGDHTLLQQHHRVVVCDKQPSYLRSLHVESDSRRDLHRSRQKFIPIDVQEVTKRFTFSPILHITRVQISSKKSSKSGLLVG